MKKIVLLVFMLTGVVFSGMAQGGGQRQRPSAEERVTRELGRLDQALKLTDAQKVQVTAILKSQAASMDSLMQASSNDREAMRGKMQPIREATDSKINEVLTADQKTTFATYRKEQQQRGPGGGGRRPAN